MGKSTQKLTILAMFIALDFVLSPIFRVEGMAPMSSVINVLAGIVMGPWYAGVMALMTGILRMTLLGIPPLALTGAVFGAVLAGWFYKLGQRPIWSALGELLGTGIIGSLLSYPVMVWFTGSSNSLYWFIYTPRFVGAAIMGGLVALLVNLALQRISQYQRLSQLFSPRKEVIKHG